jgi:hypothetical protein
VHLGRLTIVEDESIAHVKILSLPQSNRCTEGDERFSQGNLQVSAPLGMGQLVHAGGVKRAHCLEPLAGYLLRALCQAQVRQVTAAQERRQDQACHRQSHDQSLLSHLSLPAGFSP